MKTNERTYSLLMSHRRAKRLSALLIGSEDEIMFGVACYGPNRTAIVFPRRKTQTQAIRLAANNGIRVITMRDYKNRKGTKV